MPPRRASASAKTKAVKNARPGRRSAAAIVAAAAIATEMETAAVEAVEENPTSKNPDSSEVQAVPSAEPEALAAAEEAPGGVPAPEYPSLQPSGNPTVEAAATDETTTARDGDTPQSAMDPTQKTPTADVVAVNEIAVAAEKKIIEDYHVPDVIPQALDAQQMVPVYSSGAGAGAGPGSAVGAEEHTVVPGNATETAAVADVVPPAKKTRKVRKVVTRRVAVKKAPNNNEPEAATTTTEEKQNGGEEAATASASLGGEHNTDGVEAFAVSVEAVKSTRVGGGSTPDASENGALLTPVEQHPMACAVQPPAVEEPAAPVEATCAAVSSVDGVSPVAAPQKRIRKVKKIVVVRRPVKVKESSKEDKVEKADQGTTKQVAASGRDGNVTELSKVGENAMEIEAASIAKELSKEDKVQIVDRGTSEQVTATGCDNNATELSPVDENAMEIEAASVADESLDMSKDDVVSGSHGNDAEKADLNKSSVAEQEKVEGAGVDNVSAGDHMMGMSERQKRRKTEIFVGGLDRNATEGDIRKVFGKVGEIVEIRMMMDRKTGKNKGYAFVRYSTAFQAKQAVTEFAKVEICGKQCGAAALEGNDTIFLGNIDKTWKKDDITTLLHEIGVEKIDTVTLMLDAKNPDCNRGFAFLDFQTNRDAQAAFKKLQKKDAFGKGRNIKVAWAQPLVEPDEEEMQKVKSVFAEGIPSSWDEKKVKEHFKRFGQIERAVLSRNMHSAKRKDFAFVNFTTREAALSCIETFDKEIADNGSKINIKVSWAKPVPKNKPSKSVKMSADKDSSKAKSKAVQYDTKAKISVKSQLSRGAHLNIGEKSSTTHELLHVLREQAAWKQHSYPSGPAIPDYVGALYGKKRPLAAVGDNPLYSDPGRHPRARIDSGYPISGPSMAAASLEYYQQPNAGYVTGSVYGAADASKSSQMRPGSGAPYGSSTPYGSGRYSR